MDTAIKGVVSTFAWFQASASADLVKPGAQNGTVTVTKPDISVTSVADITITFTITRVGSDDSSPYSTATRPVEYGKLYEKTADHSDQTFLAKGGEGYASWHSTPASGYAVTEGWHSAINSAADDKLYWDEAADTYAGYDVDDYDTYAIFKCTWSASYTSDQAAAFNAAHATGMRSVVSFAKKGDADSSTGFWTNATNPGNFTTAPGDGTSLNLDVGPTLTGTSANGTLGYVMVFCHGEDVTATVTVGVTGTPGTFADR